jgi:Fe-S cluster assembly iron-binding protein IscA
MLTITDAAAEVIRGLSSQADGSADAGVRIASQAETAGALTLSVANGPENTDKVIETGGARLFLDPTAANLLDDKALDADVDSQGAVAFLVTDQTA